MRIAMELITNEEMYLNDAYLSRGSSGATAVKFAMFYEQYVPGRGCDVDERIQYFHQIDFPASFNS